MKQIQTRNSYFKNTTISLNWKEAIWSLTKKKKTRKQERKAIRIITLDGENGEKKVEWQRDIGLQKLRMNKITSETTKRL